MDVLYEESAVNANAQKGESRYRVVNLISKITGFLAIVFAAFLLLNAVMFAFSASSMKPEELGGSIGLLLFLFMATTLFGAPWLLCLFAKRRINVSYDYTFVSGELRIAKIFNVNRRKLVVRIQPEHIIKLGDVDSQSFNRVCADPSVKSIVCTPNEQPQKGKFFLYIATSEASLKRVYVLECREDLLVNILKFVKRGVLDSDYVMQSKKNGQSK